eukprot:CAMPEP_0119113382 /NCGR_PEP_ID=MMETSP1180-20130426/43754_1 /TAXON_ID=3052 ORGANISM="Chlamydomonas cf sp, Strain CCMP681" /NCGR_SAMPLE_ID=MMETSP1180 /ASSEMBLY_ACC=CAM_ASM_000741 /LENGTH=35 /DNA_ID= /DNA_START= /DNA_END= /DNA_ORIENTATION=
MYICWALGMARRYMSGADMGTPKDIPWVVADLAEI